MDNKSLQEDYKQRLIARFLCLLEGLKSMDQEFLIYMNTSNIEKLGIELVKVNKLLEEILSKQKTLRQVLDEKTRSRHMREAELARKKKNRILYPGKDNKA